jgi:hypothetical protein
VRPIRILFVNEVPSLTRELLRRRFAEHHDMEIVDGADVADAYSREHLLIVTVDASRVMLFEVRANQSPTLYDVEGDAIVTAIRSVAARFQ